MKIVRRPELQPSKLSERHPALYERCVDAEWDYIVREATWEDKRGLVALRSAYKAKFELDDDDLNFVADIINGHRTTGEYYQAGDGRQLTLLDGHTIVRDLRDADIAELRAAGLIERPRVDSETKAHLLKRRYWSDTPAGRDISHELVEFAMPTVGNQRGDPGEKITHALGVRLAVRHAQAIIAETLADPELPSPTFPLTTYDDTITSVGIPDVALGLWDESDQMNSIYEVKTLVASRGRNLRQAAKTLGSINASHKIWVAPNRAVAAKILNGLIDAEYVYPNPKYGPATANHALTNLNERIDAAETTVSTPHPVITRFETFHSLYAYVYARRPSVCDPDLRRQKRWAADHGDPIPSPSNVAKPPQWQGTELDRYWPTLTPDERMASDEWREREEFWCGSPRK